jgi:hypothetical protein
MALTDKEIEREILKQAEKNGYNKNHVLEALKNNVLREELFRQAGKVLTEGHKHAEAVHHPLLKLLDEHIPEANPSAPQNNASLNPFKTKLVPPGFK